MPLLRLLGSTDSCCLVLPASSRYSVGGNAESVLWPCAVETQAWGAVPRVFPAALKATAGRQPQSLISFSQPQCRMLFNGI